MKTAFHIIPEEKIGPENSILVEIGTASVAMLFFNRDPFKINGLMAYHLDRKENAPAITEQLKEIVESDELLQQNFSSIDVCYNVKESTLIPRPLFNKDQVADITDLAFGTDGTTAKFYDNIRGKDIVNVYRVDTNLVQTMKDLYSFSSSYHSNTLLLSFPNRSSGLYCIVSYDSIKVILEKDGKLLFTQQFPYSTATDIVYHLLNVLAQYNEDPASVELTVSGMISEQSNLYSEVYKYFLHIRFDELPAGVELPANFAEYPIHFFSYLIAMATCV